MIIDVINEFNRNRNSRLAAEKVISKLDELILEDPGNRTAYITKSQIYFHFCDYKKAINAIDDLIKAYPDLLQGYTFKAFIEKKSGKVVEAESTFDLIITRYKEILDKAPQDLDAQLNKILITWCLSGQCPSRQTLKDIECKKSERWQVEALFDLMESMTSEMYMSNCLSIQQYDIYPPEAI